MYDKRTESEPIKNRDVWLNKQRSTRILMDKIADIRLEIVNKVIAFVVALITIIICVLPMDDLSIWNGEIPDHRNQYELMAEAILDGRIDLAYGDETELESLENPYDPNERDQAGVKYHWDHAYYDGHYYMYFGIVPVFLAFLPYRIMTGTALTTFRATQFFTIVIIAGIFSLFRLLSKRFFERLPFGLYLSLSVAFSVMSVWYAIAEPALYCTAITAAIALEVWSLFFFIWAVYVEKRENRQILLAGVGALLGALVFGCRPPIALANIVVIPLLVVFLKEHPFTRKLAGKLALAATPYLLVAAGLMIYNYVRFDNPFEFGQAYQLTVVDQSNYSFSINGATLLRVITETIGNFFAFVSVTEMFPYLQASSVFFNFPILLFSMVALFPPVRECAKKTKVLPLLLGLFISVLVITAVDVLWSPYLLERYRMDMYFLMGIATFLTLGIWYKESSKKKALSVLMYSLSIATAASAFLLYVRTIGAYYPEKISEIAQMLGVS